MTEATSSTPAPVALDVDLCLLTIEPVQLTLNQAQAVEALLNAGNRIRLTIDLGRGPALAGLAIADASPNEIETS